MIRPQLRDKLGTAQRVTTPVGNRKESPLQRERVVLAGGTVQFRHSRDQNDGKKPLCLRFSRVLYTLAEVPSNPATLPFRGVSWPRPVRRCGADTPTPYYATSDSWSIHWLLIAFKRVTLDISPRSEHDPLREVVGTWPHTSREDVETEPGQG